MKFRKKPVVIEAFRWTGTIENTTKLLQWMFPHDADNVFAFDGTIKTLEGEMKAQKGDWIIRGVKGEFYPCKPDIFEQTHEKV